MGYAGTIYVYSRSATATVHFPTRYRPHIIYQPRAGATAVTGVNVHITAAATTAASATAAAAAAGAGARHPFTGSTAIFPRVFGIITTRFAARVFGFPYAALGSLRIHTRAPISIYPLIIYTSASTGFCTTAIAATTGLCGSFPVLTFLHHARIAPGNPIRRTHVGKIYLIQINEFINTQRRIKKNQIVFHRNTPLLTERRICQD